MRTALALAACSVLAAACAATEPSAVRVSGHQSSTEPAAPGSAGPVDPPESVTTTIEATTTTVATEPVDTTTVRRTTTSVRAATQTPVVHGDDFWYRLAMCESGAGASSPNIFQFMGGTAEKVGYYPGASYEEQRAMAIDWAARIHPREGTSAGWPVCWWKAGGS